MPATTARIALDQPEPRPLPPVPDLSDEDRKWIARTVASLGPLTQEDRDFLLKILHRAS
jgi:hypothetical protein